MTEVPFGLAAGVAGVGETGPATTAGGGRTGGGGRQADRAANPSAKAAYTHPRGLERPRHPTVRPR